MIQLFKPRLIAICATIVLLSACASNNTSTKRTPSNGYSNQSSQKSNDIWQRVRSGYAIPDLYNEEVTAKEAYYAQRADYLSRMVNRSGDFMYIIMNEVERRNMPSEIALLPFVESAFVTTAQSPVKAAGLWQFMPATGRDFALQQNHFVDQRNDVIASTDAALTFLQRLYNQFGDWHLALAAYNWGPGNVTKAVRRAQNMGLEGRYTEIKMPLETRQYVPKLQAMENIINNPAQYGITLPSVANGQRHEVVTVTRDMDMSTAAQLSGMDIDSFKRINPAYKKSIIVAALGAKILVPSARADEVRSALRSSQKLSTLTTYSTYNTESLDDIASKFATDASNLRYLNNIPEHHAYVKAGSALLVPRTQANQDIPYQALTAGLSTLSGDVGLSNGEYIEQPAIFASNTDEVTRQERSGLIAGPGLVVAEEMRETINQQAQYINPLEDPLPIGSAPRQNPTPMVRTFEPAPTFNAVNITPNTPVETDAPPALFTQSPIEPPLAISKPVDDVPLPVAMTAPAPIVLKPAPIVFETPVPVIAADTLAIIEPAGVASEPEPVAIVAAPVKKAVAVHVAKPVVKPKPVVVAKKSTPKVVVVDSKTKGKAQPIPTLVSKKPVVDAKASKAKPVKAEDKKAVKKPEAKPVVKTEAKKAEVKPIKPSPKDVKSKAVVVAAAPAKPKKVVKK